MYKLKEFFKRLFVKWELVYSTQDANKYFTILGRLNNNGIKYKIKTISLGGGSDGGRGYSIYHIYVHKDTINKANEAIHHSKY
ncbi:hypothetical protein F7731_09660 [Cytobacillus depressus]|uniref:DUF2007 domain-containing protein n=1 Tax=Cytobacillus depressus TaxID=1602942 RepID=A0A6L3V8S5_9BACI|nr:hypothetical protein F7731_09660 [Cytobacillus depressus]